MAERFRLIEHTADTGLIAYGKTLPEAFANAAYGMFSIVTDLDKVKETESREVEVAGNDLQGLLFEWLNRLVYLFDVEMLLLKRFEISKFGETVLKATCYGEKFDRSRHEINIGIKSATYHQMKIDKEKNTVQVIFDI